MLHAIQSRSEVRKGDADAGDAGWAGGEWPLVAHRDENRPRRPRMQLTDRKSKRGVDTVPTIVGDPILRITLPHMSHGETTAAFGPRHRG